MTKEPDCVYCDDCIFVKDFKSQTEIKRDIHNAMISILKENKLLKEQLEKLTKE